MTDPPSLMTGTPDPAPPGPGRELPPGCADLLSAVLEMIHVASAIFFRGEFTAPWAFVTPGPREVTQVLAPAAERLVLFHVVLEGECLVRLSGGGAARAGAGDALVLPYCDQHTMESLPPASAVQIATLLPPPPWPSIPVVRLGGGGAPTRILCGYLHCQDLLFDPVLRALPPLIHVRPPRGPVSAWLEASIRYAVDDASRHRPGAAGLRTRLPELLFIDCLRLFAQDLPDRQTGWLAALRDPAVGRALVRIHADPARDWTVEALARAAAVSRSVLAGRFTALLGTSPMRYVARWRLQLAAQRLRATGDGLSAIAQAVGYQSEAAFSRAFKRHLGLPPASWRERWARR